MATREEKDTFGDLTPLITEKETNIGVNRKGERFARCILTTFIQFYTLNFFRKKFCPTNKFGKCVSVIIKLSILTIFFTVYCGKYLHSDKYSFIYSLFIYLFIYLSFFVFSLTIKLCISLEIFKTIKATIQY